MKCPHTDFRKGQRLLILMRDGSSFVDQYIEKKSGVIVLKDLGRTKLKNVRAITIYRGN